MESAARSYNSMMTANPFLVPVGDLIGSPGKERQRAVRAQVDWGVDLARVAPVPELQADVDIVSTSGGLVVRGSAEFDAELTCSRCLTERTVPMVVEFAQSVETGVVDDDEYHTDGDVLDLEPIIRDEVLLAMPIRSQCEEGCAQLVSDTETGLNTAAPETASGADSPFAALQDLFGSGD